MSPASRGSGAFDVVRLLEALRSVDFVVVGGVAATLHGSPRLTMDLDIVPDDDEANVERLASALIVLDATVREAGARRLPVSREMLIETAQAQHGGQLRLRTKYGPLDVLWRLHDGQSYADLLPQTVVLSDEERRVRVVDVEKLIEIKTRAGRPRDRDDVAILIRIKNLSR